MAIGSDRSPGGGTARVGQEQSGGTLATVAGTYETLNLFGRRTGHCVTVQQGEPLPTLPRGFTWLLLEDAAGQ